MSFTLTCIQDLAVLKLLGCLAIYKAYTVKLFFISQVFVYIITSGAAAVGYKSFASSPLLPIAAETGA
jgi:hypothetical protein